MLKEVEMPPRKFLEVMSLARGSALGTRIQRSAVGTDLQVELGWRMVGIKMLAHNFPGRREPETQSKDFFSSHGSPPEGGLTKLIKVGQFHIKRRRTIFCFRNMKDHGLLQWLYRLRLLLAFAKLPVVDQFIFVNFIPCPGHGEVLV